MALLLKKRMFTVIEVFLKKGFSMNNVRRKDVHAKFFALLVLFSPQYLAAIPRHDIQLSEKELLEVLDSDKDYVNLDKRSSELYDILVYISKWDNDQSSLLHELKR